MSACIFCEIAQGAAAADVVLETPELVAFLDLRPVFLGHTLIVPRRHVSDLFEADGVLLGLMMQEAQRVSGALVEVVGAEGTFVAINNRVSQSVPHLHLHVVPRRKGDGLRGFFWPRQKYSSDAERAALAGRVRTAAAAAR
jgi:histidine triad (HIT) family protein